MPLRHWSTRHLYESLPPLVIVTIEGPSEDYRLPHSHWIQALMAGELGKQRPKDSRFFLNILSTEIGQSLNFYLFIGGSGMCFRRDASRVYAYGRKLNFSSSLMTCERLVGRALRIQPSPGFSPELPSVVLTYNCLDISPSLRPWKKTLLAKGL